MTLAENTTPLLITFNEAPNIGRALEKLWWAKRILVIDSGSDDGTLEILSGHPGVECLHRSFDTFAGQCNFGLSKIETPWVLSLDSDYILTDDGVKEILALDPPDTVCGFRAPFIYCIAGRKLRGSLYPPRTVLYRRDGGHYQDDGHGHRIALRGTVANLRHPILHDDRKSLQRWFTAQQGYAAREADHLLAADPRKLGRVDRVRLMAWPAPFLVVFYTLLWKGCLLDGWPGWFYTLQRLCAEVMVALALIDRRLLGRGEVAPAP